MASQFSNTRLEKVGLAQELPNILCWVQLWRIGRQEQDREVFRDLQCAGFMLARAVCHRQVIACNHREA
jgi:hypothetical protein